MSSDRTAVWFTLNKNGNSSPTIKEHYRRSILAIIDEFDCDDNDMRPVKVTTAGGVIMKSVAESLLFCKMRKGDPKNLKEWIKNYPSLLIEIIAYNENTNLAEHYILENGEITIEESIVLKTDIAYWPADIHRILKEKNYPKKTAEHFEEIADLQNPNHFPRFFQSTPLPSFLEEDEDFEWNGEYYEVFSV